MSFSEHYEKLKYIRNQENTFTNYLDFVSHKKENLIKNRNNFSKLNLRILLITNV